MPARDYGQYGKRVQQEVERGQTLLEKMWAELDQLVDDLAEINPLASATHEEALEAADMRGVARGLATAIGIVTQPTATPGTRLEAVRAEAEVRREARRQRTTSRNNLYQW